MNNKRLTYKLMFGYLGVFLIFVGVTCLLPLLLLMFYPNESNYALNFVIPGCASIFGGIILTVLLKGTKNIKLGKFQDSVLLVLIWVCAITICGIPFLCRPDMNFSQAIFETTSGFSTIGLTVFNDFDCHIYVFWRSLLTLIGGVGLVLVITTAISNKFTLNLYTAEGHNDKLLPNLRKSAIAIFGIYLGIIALGTLAYFFIFKIGGANTGDELFDALVHSISAVATGGFSSKAGGLVEIEAIYGNPIAIEIVSIVLMLAGSINFLTHFFIITGKFKKAWKDCEIRLLLGLIIVFVPLFFVSTFFGNNSELSIWESFRHGAFTFFSAITTTGFSTVSNITSLGQATIFLVVIMNIIGGGAGSTAGGVKQYRVAVAAKSFVWGTKARLAPSRVIFPHFVKRSGEDRDIKSKDSIEAFGYIILYVLLMFLGGLLITIFTKCSYGDGLFEFSNAISSTGLSNGLTSQIGIMGQSHTVAEHASMWVLIFGMFLGRLEILPIFFALYRAGRDILGKETI